MSRVTVFGIFRVEVAHGCLVDCIANAEAYMLVADTHKCSLPFAARGRGNRLTRSLEPNATSSVLWRTGSSCCYGIRHVFGVSIDPYVGCS